jgi:hypothetical protein
VIASVSKTLQPLDLRVAPGRDDPKAKRKSM